MAQKSIFWTTGSGGDGGAAYTQAEVIRWQRQQWTNDNTDEGVHKKYLQELKVTTPGSASPFNVATGAAMVYGFPYWNTSNYTASIPTPSTGTRYDRIVLQADWSNTAVRIARLGGVAGGTQASLTQTDGVKWEIPLARVTCTTNGTFTVADRRVFLHPNFEVRAAMFRASQAVSVFGRSANSTGVPADITAGTDNRLFARVSNTLGFTQTNSAMVGNSSVTAAHIARQVPIVTHHQGGTSAGWASSGGTAYPVSGARIQAGAVDIGTGLSGTSHITFPTAFSGVPLLFGQSVYGSHEIHVGMTNLTTTGGKFRWIAINASGSAAGAEFIQWVAIGPK